MRGKLIVMEAGDGSGKETQTHLLYERLQQEHYNVRKISFPNYDSDSSALIKMYLGGQFGTEPSDVNPYAASTFYAADRFASFKMEWGSFYESGGIILADRYTTSNMVHQAAKFSEGPEKDEFLQWLWDFEFRKMQLPVPDLVVWLDMPPEYSRSLMSNRANKAGTVEKDIHERNHSYLNNCYHNSCLIVEMFKWHRIRCVEENTIRTIQSIHEDIYQIVKKML